MEADFWHQRWQENQIAFHQGDANAMLVDQFHALSLAGQGRVFVPLCGKTRDIAWLLSQGHRVVGVELSKLAVDQLFVDLGVAPEIDLVGNLLRYRAGTIDIFVGDIFDLSGDIIGPVDAVYDRAALVALPADMRGRYASHVNEIADGAAQLLICFEYDQTVMPGPPFSVDRREVARVYGDYYGLTRLAGAAVEGGLKGHCPAQEIAWLLR